MLVQDVYVAADRIVSLIIASRAMGSSTLDSEKGPWTRADEVRWSRFPI